MYSTELVMRHLNNFQHSMPCRPIVAPEVTTLPPVSVCNHLHQEAYVLPGVCLSARLSLCLSVCPAVCLSVC